MVGGGVLQGPSALHRACEKGHSDAACALVDLGADVNSLTCELSTPLHVAVEGGCQGAFALYSRVHPACVAVLYGVRKCEGKTSRPSAYGCEFKTVLSSDQFVCNLRGVRACTL